MAPKRVLFSLAHPDDEAFGSGGLIAKLVAEGAEVAYICGTDGSAGTVKPTFIEKHGSVKAVRYAELDCAAQVLGFRAVYKLDYADSGMMGTPANQNPACLWQADEAALAAQIAAILHEFAPQVVITFDPYGGYGHPDHIKMHHATTRAFHQLLGQANAPQKLYYTGFPRRALFLYIWMTRLRGGNPRRIGVNKDLDLLAVRDNLLPTTTQIDVRDYMAVWDAASACHASQGTLRGSLPRWLTDWLSATQTLTCAHPTLPKRPIERDVFAGVHA